MTNATIIYNAACELVKQGVIKATGRLLMKKLPDGSLIEVPEPETIHTYNGWKALGYQVRKGEHAVAAFPIWKYSGKQDEETGEETDGHCFQKVSHFFTASQVEKVS